MTATTGWFVKQGVTREGDVVRQQPSSRPVVLNLWVATQNWVAGNIPMGREYFIKIILFLYFRRTLIDIHESVWKRK
jgi:hypothetical protein